MSEILAVTPRSNAELGAMSRTPATKDRSCPFCHVVFTSSSLGRHLDLYIKEKNPKPPDDLHDVEEIRRLREGVTRRQPRTSSVKREGSTHSSSKPTLMQEHRSPSVPTFYQNGRRTNGVPAKSPLDRGNWEAAGVVNADPLRLNGSGPVSTFANRRNNIRSSSLKEDFVRKQDALEERDRGRAAELALREVLESVRAANLRAHPGTPFDFNWFNQSFPAICLRCLSAPNSFSVTPPIPGRPSWTVEPPGEDQLRHVERWLRTRLDGWKRRRRPLGGHSYHKMNGASSHEIHLPPAQEIDDEKDYINYLSSAYQSWESLPEENKKEAWREECQRAFAREQEAHKSTLARLETAEQELHHLRTQLNERRNSQQPTEFSQFSPSTMRLSHEALDELDREGCVSNWDFESTILKWKTRIQSERNVQQPLPSSPVSKIAWPHRLVPNSLTNGAVTSAQARPGDQRVHHDDGPHTEREPQDEHEDDDDLVDAPGDDDDEGSAHNHTMPDPAVNRRALGPDMGAHVDTVMEDTTSNIREAGEVFPGGGLVPGLRAYVPVMGNNRNA